MSEGMSRFPTGDKFKRPGEFEFNRKRFKDADAKSILARISYLTHPDITDAEYKEAKRDKKDFDRRYGRESPERETEFERSYKQLKFVMGRLAEKRDDPNSDVHAALLGMSAGMAVPYGAGDLVGMDDMRVTAETFDALYAISASIPLISYYAAGQMQRGATMLCKRLSSKDFIDVTKVPEVINLRMLKNEMDNGDFSLDDDLVRNAKPTVKMIVTRPVGAGEKAHAEIVDLKTLPKISDGSRSGMSIDGLTGEIPTINGISYRDGGFDPMPIERIIEDYERDHGRPPTDILVLANRPFQNLEEMKPSLTTKAGIQLMRNRYLTPYDKFLMITEQIRQSLIYIEDIKKRKGVNVAIKWSRDMGLTSISTDGPNMTAAMFEGIRDMYEVLGAEQPQKIPWDPDALEEEARREKEGGAEKA